MRIERRDGSVEQKVLTAMIVDASVLGRVASKWEKGGLFKDKKSNLIAGWCVDFFKRYDKAPKKSIETLFASWAADAQDKATVELVERYLEGLSGNYATLAKEVNPELVLDIAAKHFNRVKLLNFAESLSGDLEAGEDEKAYKRYESYKRVEMGVGVGIDVLNDYSAVEHTFIAKTEPLIVYPEALEEFFSDSLERDGFIAYQAPEKSGKTFNLIDVAWRGLLQERRVAFFAVGDMSQNQIMMRLMCRAAKHPFKAPGGKWPFTVKVPTYIEAGGGPGSITYDERTFDGPLDKEKAWKALQRVAGKLDATKEARLRLSVHPNSSINVAGILSILQSWALEGWNCDVCVIDYADILAPPAGVAETRDQINSTWKQLRALSQTLHCLVVTATQSDAASYKEDLQNRSNFSEDKRKLSHVTGLVGINVSQKEKEEGIMRLNWIVLREGEFSVTKCVHVAGCLPIANPCMKSTF